MVARKFYVARRLEIGLNFSMQNQLLLEPTWLFFFILPQILEKVKFSAKLLIVVMIFSFHTRK